MTTPETYSVSQTSKLVGRSPNWVRLRTNDPQLIPYLSEYASPPEGQERRFIEEDLKVLKTAVILIERGKKYSEIVAILARGERYDFIEEGETIDGPVKPTRKAPKSPEEGETIKASSLATLDLLERFTIPYESQISTLENQLKEEREALEREREARVTAEKERSRLEGKLEEIERARVPWYRRLFGGGD